MTSSHTGTRRRCGSAVIAQAGGTNDRAWLRQVIVALPRSDGGAVVAVIDLSGTVDGGNAGGLGIPIGEGAVIHVPHSAISDINLFDQQYIRGVLPFGMNYSLVEPVEVFGRP